MAASVPPSRGSTCVDDARVKQGRIKLIADLAAQLRSKLCSGSNALEKTRRLHPAVRSVGTGP